MVTNHTLGATSRYRLTMRAAHPLGRPIVNHYTTASAALLVLASYRKADPDLRASLVRVGR